MNKFILLFLITLCLCLSVSFGAVESQCCASETWTSCPQECNHNCCPMNQVKMCGQKTRCMIKGEVEKAIIAIDNSISDKSCQFYDEIESLYQCGEMGYPLSFGKKYCQKFLDNYESYSNKNWQDSVRKCLQVKIANETKNSYSSQKAFVCDTLANFAFDSHVDCYVQPNPEDKQASYCNNSISDNLEILKTVWSGGAFSQAMSQAGPVACKCAFNNVHYDNFISNFLQNFSTCVISKIGGLF